jgi:hypothetical protein
VGSLKTFIITIDIYKVLIPNFSAENENHNYLGKVSILLSDDFKKPAYKGKCPK